MLSRSMVVIPGATSFLRTRSLSATIRLPFLSFSTSSGVLRIIGASLFNSPYYGPGYLVHASHAVYSLERAFLFIMLYVRYCLVFVNLKPRPYGVFLVVVPLVELASAFVAGADIYRLIEDCVVRRGALPAYPPSAKTPYEFSFGNLYAYGRIYVFTELFERRVQRLGLLYVSRKPVEDKTPGAIRLPQSSGHPLDSQFVRHQSALIHEALGLLAERRLILYVGPQDVAGRDVGY